MLESLLGYRLDKLPCGAENDCDWTNVLEKFQGKTLRRRLLLMPPSVASRNHETKEAIIQPKRRFLIIWIQPPTTTYFHRGFTELLVTWEHQMIQYQTMAGWLSTLGGGYFFCRHLSTALTLAKKQLKVALLMGDYNMAYKCVINQAYSYIYAGYFPMALKTVDSIDELNKKVDTRPLEPVIVSMQASARLFCKRFRKASKKLNAAPKGTEGKAEHPPMTTDDYQRIRIVQDQSASTNSNNSHHYNSSSR
jgi:hypothetical protein